VVLPPPGPAGVGKVDNRFLTKGASQTEPTPGRSSDVVLCPDVVPFVDHRFDCCDLP
jgi:hypothetical protein